MNVAEKRKLLGMNAAIWSIATLAAFILPFVAESIATGPAKFMQVICFAFPLIGGMAISTFLLNKSIGESST